ncbi:MAG: acyl CoA:acetate/3-ketoacid CoA transferase [Oscillospiraceae bacterium]|nr:acyl CoA:acetate/3-ketoacid CoA transferase [Oscillospiraceae bacterium]
MISKICTAAEAVALIKDGDTITPTGFIRSMAPEAVINALEARFLETGHPRNLTLLHGASASEHFVGGNAGLNRLAHEGLVTRAFSGFYGHNDRYKELIKEGKIEAYNFPLGMISHLLRAYASGKDGEMTKIGMKTYVDPRVEGGRWRPDLPASGKYVQVVNFLGEEYLYFSTPKPDVAIIRATTADEYGNLTMEDEALFSLSKVAAMAAKQNGGIVIAQVKYLVQGGSLDSQAVQLPGIFVDKIVVCDQVEECHRQTAGNLYNPIYSGHLKQTAHSVQKMPLDVRKIMARRCAMELMPDAIVNLGTGNPEFVSTVATEEGCQDMMTLTVEAGAVAGSPLPGDDFGATANAWGYLDEDRMFDLYDGGGLDIAFLGLAETDFHGNVNVSKFKGTIMGCGGFIEITQSTHKVVFLGTFTAGGLKVRCEDGKLSILQEGKHVKFKNTVEQITFSGEYANDTNQDITYVTERAVFRLTPEGLMLTEIAPGVDLEKDVLGQMEFKPLISAELKEMDACIFREGPMGLANYILANG